MQRSASRRARTSRQRSFRRSLHLETLEGRSLLATYTWTGATNANWDTDTNWQGGLKPVPGAGPDTLIFASANVGAGSHTSTNNIAGLTQAFEIQINDTDTGTGRDFNIGGTAINLGPGGITNTSTAGTTTISFTTTGLTLTAPATITTAAGATTISAAIATGAHALTINNAGTATLSGVISGSGNLTKASTGVLIMSGNNAAYAGNIVANAGTLRVSNSAALGTAAGTTTINSDQSGAANNSTVLDLFGVNVTAEPVKFVSNNTHRTTLQSSNNVLNTWGGPITIEGNDLVQFTATGTAAFNITGNISAGPAGFTGTTFFRGSGTAAVNTMSGVINMPNGTFNRTDGAVWQLNATGHSWATTSIATGELRMGAANVLPATAPLGMGQTGTNTPTLNLNGFHQTVAGLINNSTSAGTLTINSTNAATLTIDSATNTSFVNAGNTVLISGALSLVKTGVGTQTLGGANTYSGNTTINGGVLKLGAANVIPDGTNRGNVIIGATGTLDVNGFADTINGLSDAGTIDNSSATAAVLTIGGNNITSTFDGVIKNSSGALGLTKAGTGTLTLTGANTYTGATTISVGTLVVNGSVTSEVTAAAAGTLGGSGTITGNVLGAGTFSPGSGATTGILTINGDLTPTGTVNFDLSSPYTTAGTHYDRLVVNGVANLSGANITFGNPIPGIPLGTEVVTILVNDQADSIGFPISPPSGPVLIGGNSYLISYTADTGNDIQLTAQAPLPPKVYVDDDWSAFSIGQNIIDADPVAAGDQNAVFGTTAFASVNAGVAGIAGGGAATVLTVNAGIYNEAVVISKPIVVNLQQGDITFGSLDDTTTQAVLNLNGITLTSGGNNTSTTFDSVIAGSGGLIKEGTSNTGVLTLTGANTYDGLTTINRGRIAIRHATALGSAVGGTIVNGNDGTNAASLELIPTTNITVAENITLNATAAGRVTLLQTSGNNTLSGNLVTNSSTANHVQVWSNGGALNITGDISGTLSGTGNLIIRGTSTGANAITGNVNITGGIAKTDDGTWILGAAGKTYAWSSIRFARGIVRAGLANVLIPTQTLVMGESGNANAGTFDLNGFSQTVNGVDVQDGSTALAAQIITNSNTTTAATLTINNPTEDFTYEGRFTSATNATLNLLKTGAGKQTLTGASTYTGTTTIAQGTIVTGIDNAFPVATTLTVGSGTTVGRLELNTNQTVALFRSASNSADTNEVIIAENKTLIVNGTGTAFSVGLSGLGNVTNIDFSGAGTLNINNTAATVDIGVANTNQDSTLNTASMDASALGAITANVATFRIGFGSRVQTTFLMSDTDNSITATTFSVGDSSTLNASPVIAVLGAGTNVITADTINLGLGKANVNSTLRFASQAPNSPGTLTIGGKAAATANITMGFSNAVGTTGGANFTLDTRGHETTIVAGNIVIGSNNQTNSGSANGTFSFDSGTVTANSVTLATKTAAGSGAATGVLNIGGGSFTVNAGGTFRLASQATAGTATGTLNLTGGTLTSNVDITDGGGTSTTNVNINGGTLNLTGRNLGGTTLINNVTFASGGISNLGQFNNGAAIDKTTAGTLTFGGTNTYTGATTISAGTLLVDGTITSTVTNNGTVGGSGTINGNVSGPGSVVPGAQDVVGILTINGNLQTAGTVTFDLNAPFAVVGTDYDRLIVNGTVDLAGATVAGAQMLTGALAANTSFTVLQNDLADVHTLPAAPANGTDIDFGASRFKVQYNADTGNDIVFVSQAIPSTPRTINADATAVAGNDIVVKRSGNNLVVTVDGTTVLNAALATVSDLTINGQTGNDTLTVDYGSGGTFGLPIVFDGGAETGDSLKIVGGTFDTITFNYTNAHDGNVQLDPDGAGPATPLVVTYTGVDSLNSTSIAAHVVFNLPSTDDAVSLLDPATANTLQLKADSATLFTTDIATPSTSLTINGGGGADTVKVNSAQGDLALTVAGGSDADTIDILTLQGDGPLTVSGGDGADTVRITSLEIDGNLTIQGGAGDDVITLVSVPAGGAISIDGEGDNDRVDLLNNLEPTGSATFSGEQVFALGSITPAAGGTVTFNGATIIAIPLTINTSAGTGSNITFNGTVQSFAGAPANLTLNAGTGGNVLFNGAVGQAGSTTLVGQYVIEAENYTSRSDEPGTPPDSWLVVPDESASAGALTNVRGGKAVQSLPDATGGGGGPNVAPSISYAMNIATPGIYRLYVRWDGNVGSAGGSDSMYVDIVELKDGIGGTIPDHYELQHTVDGNFDTIPWDNNGGFEQNAAGITGTPMQFTITTPGTYTVRFSQREDGAAVDAFVFQLASITAPTGMGPTETGPNGTAASMALGRLGTVTITNANNVTASSSFDSGTYQQTNLQGTAQFNNNVNITGDINIDIGNTIVNGNLNVSNGGRVAFTSVGAPAVANLTVSNGGVSIGSGANAFQIGRRQTTIANTSNPTLGTADFRNATFVNINVANVLLGYNTAGAFNTGNGDQTRGSLLLSLNGSNTITATAAAAASPAVTGILVGDSGDPTNAIVIAPGDEVTNGNRIVLGNANNTIAANTLVVGGRKTSGLIRFDGSGGTLNLTNTSGGAVNVFVGDNNVNTGTINNSRFDGTGGTINAQIGQLVLGRRTGTTAANTTGTFTLANGNVNATSLTLGTGLAQATGIVNLNGGTLSVAGLVTNGAGTGTINQNGGTFRFVTLTKAAGALNYTFNDGTLQNVPGQNLDVTNAVVNLATGATHTVSVDFGQTATIQTAASISGNSLTKTGGGTLVLPGANTYSGTTINQGIVRVENTTGSATGFGDVVVNVGGTLMGEGTISGNVILNGNGQPTGNAQLIPGLTEDDIGTLNIQGNLTFNNAYTQVEVSSTGNDLATVTGQVNITGTTIAEPDLIGGYVPPNGAPAIVVLTSGSGITGAFAGTVNPTGPSINFDGTNAQVRYNGGDGNDLSVTFIFNLPPVASNDTFTVNEDTVLNGNVVTNTNPNGADSDPNNDPLSGVALVGPAPAGTFNLLPTGAFTYTPPAHFSGSASFQYTVRDSNNEPSNTATVTINVTAVADQPNLTVTSPATGNEDANIPLAITSTLVDTSETLQIRISNVPTGATLSAGTNTGGGVWTLNQGDLTGLTIRPPAHSDADFTLTVTAISTDTGNVTAQRQATVNVVVNPLADAPTLTVTPASGAEDSQILLPINAALVDTDGSETMAVRISGVPAGVLLSAGNNAGGGNWDLTSGQLSNLRLTPIVHSDADFTLTVTATTTDTGGGTAQSQATLPVTVLAAADAPTLNVVSTSISGLQGVNISLGILLAELVDKDDSESLAVTVTLPAGSPATIVGGTDANNDGTWDIPLGNLSTAAIRQVPSGTFPITLRAIATETAADANPKSTSTPININVTIINAPPQVTLVDVLIVDESAGVVSTLNVLPGLPFSFVFNVAEPATYVINWGDGSPPSAPASVGANVEATITHTLTRTGTFQPVLTVTDLEGGVTVFGPGKLPLVVTKSVIEVGGIVYVAGTSGTDRMIFQNGASGPSVRINNVLTALPSVGEKIVAFGLGGNDNLTVNGSLSVPVEFYGGDGDDYIAGGSLGDTLDGGAGKDRLLGGGGADTLLGGAGNDTLAGGVGNDFLYGDGVADEFGEIGESATPGNDSLSGDAGDDYLQGGGGNDTVTGGVGNDFLRGGAGTDRMDGGNGDDLLVGDAGADTLYGRNGSDLLIGGTQSDTLYGGAGPDLVYGAELASMDDFDLVALWMTFGDDPELSLDDLESSAVNDNIVDVLHGEGDSDWYLYFINDTFKLAAEKKSPNVPRLIE